MSRTPRAKKSAFVPRSVLRATIVGGSVVPFCASLGMSALEPGCGGGPQLSVACICFDSEPCTNGCLGVAASCFTDPTLPECDAGDGGLDATRDGPAKDAPDVTDGFSDADVADAPATSDADAAEAGDRRDTGG